MPCPGRRFRLRLKTSIMVVLLILVFISSSLFVHNVRSAAPTPTITLNPKQGIIGSTVNFVISGFPPNAYVEVFFGCKGYPDITSVEVNPGTNAGSFTVPDVGGGTGTVIATDVYDLTHNYADEAKASFVVLPPTITLNSTDGPVGSTVAFAVSNFPPNAYVEVFFGDEVNGVGVKTDSTGFSKSTLMVPDVALGKYSVIATDIYDTTDVYEDYAGAWFTVTEANAQVTGTVTLVPDPLWIGLYENSWNSLTNYYGGVSYGGSCNPLANSGLSPYESCVINFFVPAGSVQGAQQVNEAAVYANGNEPMAYAAATYSTWTLGHGGGGAGTFAYAIANWPYLILNKTTGKPLDSSTYYSNIPLDLSYSMSLSASGGCSR